MDLEDDALGELDLVIGSVHSYMNLEAAEMTDRLLRALECPHLRVLGHPTGRQLMHRDPFPFDFDAVAAPGGAEERVSGNQRELRSGWIWILRASLIRAAKARGCKFAVNTDAHHPKHLANMRYGVSMARRGWLEAPDILNTRSLTEFAQAIHSK